MEILVLILSSLISLVSPVNLATDKVAENAIRSQFQSVEVIKVRVDNAPIHQPALGKADKVRIAGRGLFPLKNLRIDTLEIETDPINVNRRELFKKRGKLILDEPLGVATRIVVKQEDIVRALTSPEVLEQLQKLLSGNRKQKAIPLPNLKDYKILNPKVELLKNQRLRLEAEIEQISTSDKLQIQAETGVRFLDDQRLVFEQPTLSINGQPLPEEFLKPIAGAIAEQLNLKRLEQLLGIKARVFKFSLENNQLEIATFLLLPKGFKV